MVNESTVIKSTPSGSVVVKQIRRRKGCELLHSTKPIKWKAVGGEAVSLLTRTWTVPTKRIPADATEMACTWQKVEDDMTQFLPHHDQRVLSYVPDPDCRCPESAELHFMSTSGPYRSSGATATPFTVKTISTNKRVGLPTCIALHPSSEWIVIGTRQNGLYLVHARPLPDDTH